MILHGSQHIKLSCKLAAVSWRGDLGVLLTRKIFSSSGTFECNTCHFAGLLRDLVDFLDTSDSPDGVLPQLSLTLPHDIAAEFDNVLESMYTGHAPTAVQLAAASVADESAVDFPWSTISLSGNLAGILYGFIGGDGSQSQPGTAAGAGTASAQEGKEATLQGLDIVKSYSEALRHFGVEVGPPPADQGASLSREEAAALASARLARSEDATADISWAWGTEVAQRRAAALCRLLAVPDLATTDAGAVQAALTAWGGVSVFCPKEGSLPWTRNGIFQPGTEPPDEGLLADEVIDDVNDDIDEMEEAEGKGGEGGGQGGQPTAEAQTATSAVYTYGDLLQGAPPLFWVLQPRIWAGVFAGQGSMAELQLQDEGARMGDLIRQTSWQQPAVAPLRPAPPINIEQELPRQGFPHPVLPPPAEWRQHLQRTGGDNIEPELRPVNTEFPPVRGGLIVPDGGDELPAFPPVGWRPPLQPTGGGQHGNQGDTDSLSSDEEGLPASAQDQLQEGDSRVLPVEDFSPEHLIGAALAPLFCDAASADLLLTWHAEAEQEVFLPVHRSLLAAGSTYFRSILSGSWQEECPPVQVPPTAHVLGGLDSSCTPVAASEQQCAILGSKQLPCIRLQAQDVGAEDGPAPLLLAVLALYAGDKRVFQKVFSLAVHEHIAAGRPVDSSPLHTSAQLGAGLVQVGAFLGVSSAVIAGEDILVASLHSDTVGALAQLAEDMSNDRLAQACSEFLRTHFAQLVYPLSSPGEAGLSEVNASHLGHVGVFLPHLRCVTAQDGTEWPVGATEQELAFVPGLVAPEGGADAKWTSEHLTVGRVFRNTHGVVIGWTPLSPMMRLSRSAFEKVSVGTAFPDGGQGKHASALREAGLGASGNDMHLVPPVAELPEHLLLQALVDEQQQADEATLLQGALHWSKRAAFAAAEQEAAAAGKAMKRKGPKFLKKRLGPLMGALRGFTPLTTGGEGVSSDGAAAAATTVAVETGVVQVSLADCLRLAFVPGTSVALQSALDSEALPEDAVVSAVQFADVHSAEAAQMRSETAGLLAGSPGTDSSPEERWRPQHPTRPRAWALVLAAGAASAAQALAVKAASKPRQPLHPQQVRPLGLGWHHGLRPFPPNPRPLRPWVQRMRNRRRAAAE